MDDVSWTGDDEGDDPAEEPVDDAEVLEMNVAEARRRGLEARIAELTGLSLATVEEKLAEPHGRTLLRTVFESGWPNEASSPTTEELGAMTAREARDQDAAEAIADVAGLSKAAVRRRLEAAHGRMLVSNVFADRWPGNEGVDDLGRMTAADARDGRKARRIAEVTRLAVGDVERELAAAHGRTLVCNVFASSWPGFADASTLGGMTVLDARSQGLVGTIAKSTGLSAQSVGRRLYHAHGRTLVRNAFGEWWPEGE